MRRALLALVLASALPAQQTPRDGPGDTHADWHALVGAHVVVEPGRELEGATIVVRGDRIEAVLEDGAAPPAGARAWDCAGLTIYAAFVDPHVRVDVQAPQPEGPLAHWNPNVLPARTALDGGGLDEKVAAALRANGFGAAAVAPSDGVFRGRSAVVLLDTPRDGERRAALQARDYHAIGFASRAGQGVYPRSLMGAIALIRQTLLDAAWNGAQSDAATRPGLQALAEGPLLFDARDELEALRGAKIATEAGRDAILLGSGTEFRRLEAIAATGLPVIAPLDFPAPPRIDTLDARENVTLLRLATWEQAPTNVRRLLDAGISVSLTSDRLADRAKFMKRLRKAIELGLTHDRALAALTTTPAELLRIGDRVGRIAPGLLANLLLVDGRLGEEKGELRALWIRGRRHALREAPQVDLDGRWQATLSAGGASVDAIEFDGEKKATLFAGEKKVAAAKLRSRGRQVDLAFDARELGGEGIVTLNAIVDGKRIAGAGVDAAGARFGWSAKYEGTRVAEAAADAKPKAKPDLRTDAALLVPFGEYGREALPPQEEVLVRGATIWTSADAGIIENGALLVRDGKVAWVGAARDAPDAPNARIVDGAGLQLTPGLIDCHSHTGISKGTNEGTQSVTAEVRVGDVIDPDDIGWYRELAGGLTAVNQLHGSANPIGGQNSVVKLRWGVPHPDHMRLDGAPPGIKFALGENVKRSNSEQRSTRYPQTRMGVEALIRERFAAARDYDAARERGEPVRQDLELDALAEILRGERLVHCHSYRQDEILMLCRVARDFGFRIGTFQHGLECYKVADAVREVSRGASIFTDWWAYKFEVYDAIPENGAILDSVGVTVSFNSDSNELARRMNVEAAKAAKYGGVPRARALHFVTINPARQLGVDDRIGSLEAGKDADFAVWNGDPLSATTRCVSTWIDGRRYWSAEEDLAARAHIRAERERLFQVLLALDDAEFDGAETDDTPGQPFTTIDNMPGDCGCCEEGQR